MSSFTENIALLVKAVRHRGEAACVEKKHAVPAKRVTLTAVLLSIAALISGCAAGPDFHRPAAPAVSGYTRKPLKVTGSSPAVPGGEGRRFVKGMDIPAQWWKLFRSQHLNKLIERALAANPTVASAQAALHQARENVKAQQAQYFPSVQVGGTANRIKEATGTISPTLNSGTPIYNLYTGQVAVSFTPDVFGANRRQVESLAAQADYQRFQLEATYLTLASNVVAAAIQEASLRAQIASTRSIIDIETRMLDITRNRLALGYVCGLDVAAQESALAQARQALPPLQMQLAQVRDQLKALTGRFPSEHMAERFDLDTLHLPAELPVSLPSRLVEQRPDVRAAEEQLHSACAQVGVAVANMLPQILLSGNLGTTATQMTDLFIPGNGFWNIGSGLTQTIFDAGALLHRKRAAEAGLEQTKAQYRDTVLTAFRDVADTLHAIESDANALLVALVAERAARKTLDITRRQYALGYTDYVALLSADQAYRQALISLVQARAARFADTAALFQALGGGWWNRSGGASARITSSR